MVVVLWGWDEGHGGLRGLLGVQGEGHLGQLLLEDEGGNQQEVLREDLGDLLVEIQGVVHHLGGGVQDLGIQGKGLVEEDLWVEMEAWILVASHWGYWAWNLEFPVCLLLSA